MTTHTPCFFLARERGQSAFTVHAMRASVWTWRTPVGEASSLSAVLVFKIVEQDKFCTLNECKYSTLHYAKSFAISNPAGYYQILRVVGVQYYHAGRYSTVRYKIPSHQLADHIVVVLPSPRASRRTCSSIRRNGHRNKRNPHVGVRNSNQ